jgi:hypothetical protein
MKGQPKTKGYDAKAARASRARRKALAKQYGFNEANATTWRVK